MSNADQFEEHVARLEAAFPGVPSIGCIDMCYDTKVVEKGVGVVAYEGVTAVAGVLEQVSSMPIKYIQRFKNDLDKVRADSHDTVCIGFCMGNDACVMSTVGSVLGQKNVSLAGGTGDAGKVSVNGKIYTDADAYVFVKKQQRQGRRVQREYLQTYGRGLQAYRFQNRPRKLHHRRPE